MRSGPERVGVSGMEPFAGASNLETIGNHRLRCRLWSQVADFDTVLTLAAVGPFTTMKASEEQGPWKRESSVMNANG